MIKKRLVKKTTALAITGALTIAMTATVLAAPGGPGGGPGGGRPSQEMQQGPGGDFGQGSGESGEGAAINEVDSECGARNAADQREGALPQQAPTGERPEMPGGEEPTGERPEMPGGEEPTGERPEMPGGEEPTGERPEMPSGDEPTGERPEMPGGKGGRDGWKNDGKDMKGMNIDEIASAIDALEDEEVKSNLETLLNDYETAKAALETAMEEESEDIDSYREAEFKAMEALRTALDEAGIDTRPELPEGEEQADDEDDKPAMGQRPERQTDDSTDTMPEKPAMQQDGNASKDSNRQNENVFVRFGNWLKSLFSR